MSAPLSWYVLSMHQANRSWWWWMQRSTSNATFASCAKISFPVLGELPKKWCACTWQCHTIYCTKYTQFSSGEGDWGYAVACSEPWSKPHRTYNMIFETRWGCLWDIWITLSQWLGYERPCCKIGAHWPSKDWRSLYGACPKTEGRDGRQGRSYPI